MKYVYLALNWGFGVLFLLAGAVSLIENPFGGLCLLAISALLLPPVRNFGSSPVVVGPHLVFFRH